MTVEGHVRLWHDDDGWGVIDSRATPGGCWTHFSTVRVDGYAALAPGQPVVFTFEPVEQDGYAYRTVEARPADRPPARAEPSAPASPAMRSTLSLSSDALPPEEDHTGAS